MVERGIYKERKFNYKKYEQTPLGVTVRTNKQCIYYAFDHREMELHSGDLKLLPIDPQYKSRH